MPSVIIHCNCQHEYQDQKYGKGKRVANKCKTGKSGDGLYRCTVCSKETSRQSWDD